LILVPSLNEVMEKTLEEPMLEEKHEKTSSTKIMLIICNSIFAILILWQLFVWLLMATVSGSGCPFDKIYFAHRGDTSFA